MFCAAHFLDISQAVINNHLRKSELPYQERLCDGLHNTLLTICPSHN